MKASEYRRLIDAEFTRPVARDAAPPAEQPPSTDDLLAEMTDVNLDAQRRAQAVARAESVAIKSPRLMNALIGIVADPGESAELRRAALSALETGSFKTVEFRPYAPDFRAALRAAATDDDAELRAGALDILSLDKDSYAQQLLVDGLRNPDQALVEPVHAVRMLGYDIHADHYPLLRAIVETSSEPSVRSAALRLLAADSDSRAMMGSIAADKSEDTEARTTAAVALQSLSPDDFERVADAVVLDDDDDSEVRAVMINALAHGSAQPGPRVTEKIRDIDDSPGGAPQVNRAARAFTVTWPRDPA